MNVVIEGNRIARITSAGTPGVPAPKAPPREGEVIDATGMYLMPGFVNLHGHLGRVERVGGVRYTIKDGIVYDAKRLLADVAAMVERQKQKR
jgi:imidazolonepropionase-like amidohydrolase